MCRYIIYLWFCLPFLYQNVVYFTGKAFILACPCLLFLLYKHDMQSICRIIWEYLLRAGYLLAILLDKIGLIYLFCYAYNCWWDLQRLEIGFFVDDWTCIIWTKFFMMVNAAAALRVLYSSLNSPGQLTKWTSNGGDPCGESWRGVTCSGNKVTEMSVAFYTTWDEESAHNFQILTFPFCSMFR